MTTMTFRSLRRVSDDCSLSPFFVLIDRIMTNTMIDSIAGQVAAIKGQPTAEVNAKPRRPRRELRPAEESDYESDTDEDVDSESATDTDTDSEAEDEKAKSKGWW